MYLYILHFSRVPSLGNGCLYRTSGANEVTLNDTGRLTGTQPQPNITNPKVGRILVRSKPSDPWITKKKSMLKSMPINKDFLLDPITITKRNRLNMHNRITNGNNQTLKALLQRTDPSSWAEENRTLAERIGLDENALTTKKQISKREITNKIKVAFKEEIEGKGRDKSKVKFLLEGKNKWDPDHQPEYMKTLTRNEVSTIFKARTRMLDVKANYKNKYQDLQCRLCGKEDETQEHVLAKCEKTKQTKHQVPTEDIFTEDPEKLRKTAAEIEVILNTINNPPPPTQKNHQGKQP